VSSSRLDALAVVGSLTLAFGMLSHLVVEAVVTGSQLEVVTPLHGVMLVVATVLLAYAFARVAGAGAGGTSDGRRRRALLRATLAVGTARFIGAVALAQAVIAVGILDLERIHIAPSEMVAAAISGLVAVLAGSLALHVARRRVIVVLTTWTCRKPPHAGCSATLARARRARPRTRETIPLLRSRPDRAPPEHLAA
jgi:hypothetical protein